MVAQILVCVSFMIRLTPAFKEKVWGSTRLEPLFPNSQNKIGEVWFEGVDDLPLLIKFLFTTEKLSVQVHPNDAYARLHHGSRGKTEMWYVLAAEPGAQVAAGFRETITPQRLREASLSGEIEDMLQWFDAAPGDVFFIPAGTVHAIGAGLTLCEIQEHSDITYRLHDYGRPRELHLDRGVEVSHLGPHSPRQKTNRNSPLDLLVSCPYFSTSRLSISNSTQYIAPSGVSQFLVLLEGSGTINGQPMRAGEVWYLEENSREIQLSGTATLLHILP
ncbi:MAG: type I phosphomannose isomerase catalytic subunit [Bryobacteraceae bacterium]|jgi:mannose-6-phosphate isomerase